MSDINAEISRLSNEWWFKSLDMCDRVKFWHERRQCENSVMFIRRLWIRENVECFREICNG